MLRFHTVGGKRTSIAALSGLSLFCIGLAGAPKYRDWSPPQNLGSAINSPAEDFGPAISKNGLSLYFTSTRPGGLGGEDLWVARRSKKDGPWTTPVNLGPILNTDANERSPALSRNGHHLYFATNRPGGSGGIDIWVSWRHDTHDDLAWQAPVNLGPQLNSAATDAGPTSWENDDGGIPLLFLASNRPGGAGALDIYVSRLTASGTFGVPDLVAELNGNTNDLTPFLRHDGLEIIISSARPGGSGAQDLWVSTRDDPADAWSTPEHLGPVLNSSGNDNFPALTSDGETLLFSSDRPGGAGGTDIYVSTRSKRGRAHKN
jgi:Tol biopolymer transport system component